MFTTDDLFDIAINMEVNGGAVYRAAASRVTRTDLKEMIQWMADEENRHRKWFEEQKGKLKKDIDEQKLKEMVPDAFQEMMGEKALSLDDTDFSRITGTRELLETFIGFEEDTVMFYEMLEMFITDDSVKDGLDRILKEERNHVRQLRDKIRSL